ncbi:MAG: hypothetical protein GC154_15245 [bacterium]|nr:hypothetical protein [bacterium]
MSNLKSDHFAFPVSDLDAAIDFYSNRLGLRLMFRQLDEAHHEAFAFLELEGANLELLQSLDEHNRPLPVSPAPPAASFCPHLALSTHDLDGWIERLAELEIEILKGPLLIPGQVKWLYFADPDGNILELVEWLNQG